MNKKVLLRERKRHTARRVASTPYVVLTGYPPGQGTPPARVPPWPGYPPGQGTPSQGTPPARVPPWPGYPVARVPQGTPPARVPPCQGTPLPGYPPQPGYPPWLDLAGYPPGWTWQGTPPSCPMAFWGNVAKHYGIRVPPRGQTDRHVSKHYLPHPSDAGGKNLNQCLFCLVPITKL